MACNLTRSEVSDLVLDVIRKREKEPGVTENTRFHEDLRVDPLTRRGYFRPIKDGIEAHGCVFRRLSPDVFENAADVKGIVDAVWADVSDN